MVNNIEMKKWSILGFRDEKYAICEMTEQMNATKAQHALKLIAGMKLYESLLFLVKVLTN